PTMKFGILYRTTANCTVAYCELAYTDSNFPGRIGWKEVIVSPAAGVTVESSSAPFVDQSAQLSNYPTDLIKSPPSDLAAKIVYSCGSRALSGSNSQSSSAGAPRSPERRSPVSLKPNQQLTPRSSFTELMTTQHLSFSVILLAALIAAGLGALHALEPG